MTALTTGPDTSGLSCPRPDVSGPLHELLDLPPLDRAAIDLCRQRAAGLSDRITLRIRTEVAAFAAARDRRVDAAVSAAITAAVDTFVEALARRQTDSAQVFSRYRHLGALQASAKHDLDAMQAAHQIATQESWDEVRHISDELKLTPEVMTTTSHAIITYQRLLLDAAAAGFQSAQDHPPAARHATSTLLVVELTTRNRPERVHTLATMAGWAAPSTVAVIAAENPSTADLQPVLARFPRALAVSQRSRMIIVVDAQHVAVLARQLADRVTGRVAATWGVDLTDVHHATRWALHALALAEQGVIDAGSDQLICCRNHQVDLCLHADPALRRHADENLLAPLLQLTPKRRIDLAETMLLWLQTRHSAPELAKVLLVHEQTVRHRLRHVKKLFAGELADPAGTVGLLTALESTVPRWRRETA